MPPSVPPLTSLQGMPPELRNQVYELVAIDNISMRVISGKKLVASYQALNKERAPRLERTDRQWFVSDRPMASIKVPIIDVASILPSTTARHAVSNTSRQLRAEFQAFEGQVSASEYVFILENFDLKQMELVAGTIRALDKETRQKHLSTTITHHVCFAIDDDAVRSAGNLCAYIEQKGKLPPGLEFITHRMERVQVRNGLTPLQAEQVYTMFDEVRQRTHGGGESLRPIRFVDLLFQRKVQLHRARGLGKWGMCA